MSTLMMFSNVLAVASGQNGLQASSVPLLIALAMVSLLSYINGYMLRRRSKEFATYLLLGMRRGRLATVFFGESLVLSFMSLAVGIVIGGMLFPLALSLLSSWFPIETDLPSAYGAAVRDTLLYFAAVQTASLLVCVRKIRTLDIGGLLSEGRRNQVMRSRPRPVFWSALCAACLLADTVCVAFVTSGNDMLTMLGMNVVVVSLVAGTWAFYQAAFHVLAWLRANRRSELYRGNRLYLVGTLLSRVASNVVLNTVLSVCLLFSALAFSVGLIAPNIPNDLFEQGVGTWLSFAEICLCIVFLTMYFSILAVRHVVEAKENRHAFQVFASLGKKGSERKALVKREIALKYLLPAVMCGLVLLLCVGTVNEFLNGFLLADNLLLISLGCFAACFSVMCVGYGFVAYRLCVRQLVQR